MKKILGVGLVGLIVVGAVVLANGAVRASTPEGKMCVKLAELCGANDKTSAKLDSCIENLQNAKKIAGNNAVDRSMACVEHSDTCMAATGCMMGGVGVSALGEMMKGFGEALSH